MEVLEAVGEIVADRVTLPANPPKLVISTLKVASEPCAKFWETGVEAMVKSGISTGLVSLEIWPHMAEATTPEPEPRSRIRTSDQNGTGFRRSGLSFPRCALGRVTKKMERASLRTRGGITPSTDFARRLTLGSINAFSSPEYPHCPSRFWGSVSENTAIRVTDYGQSCSDELK